MLLKLVLPSASVALLIFAVVHVTGTKEKWETGVPTQAPSRSPFAETVSGAGVIEAQTENIEIGAAVPGIVQEVFAQEGQQVRKGEALFCLDDRALRAELLVREAALVSAEAELSKLQQMPRSEELPVLQAKVHAAEANLADTEFQYNRIKKLFSEEKASDEELNRYERAFEKAQAELAGAQAELDLKQAGAWESDLAVARAAVERAEALVAQIRTELDRLIIRAPVDSHVLQMNVRSGEPVAFPPLKPLAVLGDVQQLHVRVDIDEYDILRFRQEARAEAVVRGSPQDRFSLSFVRIEPFVIPKRSLTGENFERVDTRVLQVIYVIDPQGRRLYVGQQVDVFVNADAPAETKLSSEGS